MTYLVDFSFFESEKEDNVTWDFKMCKTILKDQENMPQVIITDRDTTLMNSIATVFPTSSTLLCKYHIIKNMRSRVKHVADTKQVKHEDGKLVKSGVMVENIINAWNSIINSSIEELYVDHALHLRSVYVIYPYLLKYI